MSARLIVADAGPLIALAVSGVLPLSIGMLGRLFVPETVLQECTPNPSAPGAAIIHDMLASGGFQIIPQASLAPLYAGAGHRGNRCTVLRRGARATGLDQRAPRQRRRLAPARTRHRQRRSAGLTQTPGADQQRASRS